MIFGCKEQLGRSQFAKDMLHNAQYHGRHCICLSCVDKGLSPKDLTWYSCANGCRRGHRKLQPKNLENHKSRGDKLVCLECRDKAAADTQREKRICAAVKKSRYLCSCRNPIHTEKCPLFGKPRSAFWEGCDTVHASAQAQI